MGRSKIGKTNNGEGVKKKKEEEILDPTTVWGGNARTQ